MEKYIRKPCKLEKYIAQIKNRLLFIVVLKLYIIYYKLKNEVRFCISRRTYTKNYINIKLFSARLVSSGALSRTYGTVGQCDSFNFNILCIGENNVGKSGVMESVLQSKLRFSQTINNLKFAETSKYDLLIWIQDILTYCIVVFLNMQVLLDAVKSL